MLVLCQTSLVQFGLASPCVLHNVVVLGKFAGFGHSGVSMGFFLAGCSFHDVVALFPPFVSCVLHPPRQKGNCHWAKDYDRCFVICSLVHMCFVLVFLIYFVWFCFLRCMLFMFLYFGVCVFLCFVQVWSFLGSAFRVFWGCCDFSVIGLDGVS